MSTERSIKMWICTSACWSSEVNCQYFSTRQHWLKPSRRTEWWLLRVQLAAEKQHRYKRVITRAAYDWYSAYNWHSGLGILLAILDFHNYNDEEFLRNRETERSQRWGFVVTRHFYQKKTERQITGLQVLRKSWILDEKKIQRRHCFIVLFLSLGLRWWWHAIENSSKAYKHHVL